MVDILQPPGHTISYFPKLTTITGSIKAAILCQQVTYLTPREEGADTWLSMREAQWMKETALTLKEFRGAVQDLEGLKLIHKRYDRINHTLQLQLDIENYNAAIQGLGCSSPPKLAPAKKQVPKKQVPKGHMPKGQVPTETSVDSDTSKLNMDATDEQVPKGHMPKGQVAGAKREDEHMPKGHFANNVVEAEFTTEVKTEKETTEDLLSDSGESDATAAPLLTIDWVITQWNEMAERLGIPKKTDRGAKNENLRRKIALRLKENPDAAFWETVLANFSTSSLLRGEKDWKPALDWLVDNDHNAVKVYEGNYTSNGHATTPQRPQYIDRSHA